MPYEDTGTVKLQANLDGYEAWAFSRLMQRSGRKNHDQCRTIVREWFQLRRQELRDEYGISREDWERERGGNVRPMTRTRKVSGTAQEQKALTQP
jgi:hypothetical protein